MHDRKESLCGSKQKEVWEGFVNGDQHCFKLLFKRYYQEMYGYGFKLCGNPELVKDCIQDLFKTIWERRDGLDHIKSPNVYLFVSLRRKILKLVQKERKTDGELDEIDESMFLSFGMEEIIITNERINQQKKALKDALNQLSNRQREVVYLHFYNGMSYREIEEILSINRQSVWNHMHRAMETLRTILDKEVMKLVITLAITFFFFLSYFL